jgi:hypothetical protein
LIPSASQRLIQHGVFTYFQQHGPVSVDLLLNVMEATVDITLEKGYTPKQQPCCKGKSDGCIMDKIQMRFIA